MKVAWIVRLQDDIVPQREQLAAQQLINDPRTDYTYSHASFLSVPIRVISPISRLMGRFGESTYCATQRISRLRT